MPFAQGLAEGVGLLFLAVDEEDALDGHDEQEASDEEGQEDEDFDQENYETILH